MIRCENFIWQSGLSIVLKDILVSYRLFKCLNTCVIQLPTSLAVWAQWYLISDIWVSDRSGFDSCHWHSFPSCSPMIYWTQFACFTDCCYIIYRHHLGRYHTHLPARRHQCLSGPNYVWTHSYRRHHPLHLCLCLFGPDSSQRCSCPKLNVHYQGIPNYPRYLRA